MYFSTVCAVVCAGVASASPDPDHWQQFENFMTRFGKKYKTNEEQNTRFAIFSTNLDYINAQNAKNLSYTLGITKFADLTSDEWRMQVLTPNLTRSWGNVPKLGVHRARVTEVMDAVDWSEQGAVTDVKDQGQCGACWAFCSTGAIEGAVYVSRGKLVSVSEQMLMDCGESDDKNDAPQCSGYNKDDAFSWVQNNGLCSEADYPYQCADGKSEQCTSSQCNSECHKALEPNFLSGYYDVDSDSERSLESAVAQQPVAVTIDADETGAFQHYNGGILTVECGEEQDHCVTAVGYGSANGQKYWKLKNSWGADWGENGYARILRGSREQGGECGIRKNPSYPTVSSVAAAVVV